MPTGDVITELNEAALAEALRAARAEGIDAVAIAFLHAHVTPDARGAGGRRWRARPGSPR